MQSRELSNTPLLIQIYFPSTVLLPVKDDFFWFIDIFLENNHAHKKHFPAGPGLLLSTLRLL